MTKNGTWKEQNTFETIKIWPIGWAIVTVWFNQQSKCTDKFVSSIFVFKTTALSNVDVVVKLISKYVKLRLIPAGSDTP